MVCLVLRLAGDTQDYASRLRGIMAPITGLSASPKYYNAVRANSIF
jgi:hypothetical protein